MIYLALAVLGLHIISLPVIVGIFIYVDSDSNVGKIKVALFGMPVFVKRINTERIFDRFMGNGETYTEQSDENEQDKEKKQSKLKSFLIDCARRIVMRVRVRNAELTAVIGTGDAAVSATAVGIVRIMYAQACAFFGFDGECATISPEYDSERIYFDFFGIFSLCFADIIVAVCSTLFERISRKSAKRSEKYANTVAE